MSNEEANLGEARPIGASEYVAPVLKRRAFHCPHCGVYAPQSWHNLSYYGRGNAHKWSDAHLGECFNCHDPTYWLGSPGGSAEDQDGVMVFPFGSTNAPPPHPDFPADPKADYEEARSIVDRSPRGATALLRLAVQKLCNALGEPGRRIDDDVASLVRKGLPPGVQKALDSLRVIGNNAVHPGQMDLRDDRDTATALFGTLNFIVEQMITRPKELDAIYNRLPESSREYIEKRDAKDDGSD